MNFLTKDIADFSRGCEYPEEMFKVKKKRKKKDLEIHYNEDKFYLAQELIYILKNI